MRRLDRAEIPLIWSIDRSETHERTYELRDGSLALIDNYFEMPGWHPRTIEEGTPKHYAAFDRGASFLGMFDGDALIGVAVLDGERLAFLYVSAPYRGTGVGTALFEAAVALAPHGRVVVSATPTENTVNFYLARGCVVDQSPDPAQVAEEPDDIQLVFTP